MSGLIDRTEVLADRLGEHLRKCDVDHGVLAGECERRHLRHGGDIHDITVRVDAMKKLVVANREACLVAIGGDGRNGRLSENQARTADHEKRLRKVEDIVTRNDTKIIIYSSGFAALAATLMGVIAHFLTK